MDNTNVTGIVVAVLIVLACALGVLWLAEHIRQSRRKRRYIVEEMNRAECDDEYRYWRRELRCLYLRYLPFVTERNMLQVYNWFFHRARHASPKNRSDSVWRALAPSVLGLVVCAVCLCGASWAWFTASTATGTVKIQAASFHVDAVIEQADTSEKIAPESDGVYTLDGERYALTLRRSDESTSSKGYCRITVSKDGETAGTPYCTAIVEETDYTFTVENHTAAKITVKIEPIWGEPESAAVSIQKGGTISVGDREESAAPAPDATVSSAEESPVSGEEMSIPTGEAAQPEESAVPTPSESSDVAASPDDNSKESE